MQEIKITRSKRRSVGLHINPDLTVELLVPLEMSREEIDRFISEKSWWIDKHLAVMRERVESNGELICSKLTAEELRALAAEARVDIPERVRRYAAISGVTYSKITIRGMKTRWGSCTSNENLSFNSLLMLCPEEMRDYVVVHELCHLKEPNHSPRFWALVESVLPDYKERHKWFKEKGWAILARIS